jgi:hypothetical protein
MSRRLLPVLALVGATLVAACDSGPKGPGTLPATVTGSQALGAVVLDITGDGIEGFDGEGDTQAYSAVLGAQTGQPARHRVVLVSASGGSLHFGIRVTDRGSVVPTATVISAATPGNLVIPPAGLQVNIER